MQEKVDEISCICQLYQYISIFVKGFLLDIVERMIGHHITHNQNNRQLPLPEKEGFFKMLGNVIKKLRTEYQVSQTQLANHLGISKQSVSNWENDNILPSIEMLVRISEYFGVSCDFLLELDHRTLIEVTNITPAQRALIQQLIQAFQEANG